MTVKISDDVAIWSGIPNPLSTSSLYVQLTLTDTFRTGSPVFSSHQTMKSIVTPKDRTKGSHVIGVGILQFLRSKKCFYVDYYV